MDMIGKPIEALALLDDRQIESALVDAIRGNGLHRQGRLSEVLAMYLRAIAKDACDPWSFNDIAYVYQEMVNQQKALDAWHHALKIVPVFEPAFLGIKSLKGK